MIELKPCPICGAEAEIINDCGVGMVRCSNGCRFLKRIIVNIEYNDSIDYYYEYAFQFGDHVRTKKKEAVSEWNTFETTKGEAGTTHIIP